MIRERKTMAKIFVYYSLSGNGDTVAAYLKEQGYEILKLETQKAIGKVSFFKMMHYGGRASFHKKESLKPYVFNEKAYEKIIVGTPVWADKIATPVNQFLSEHPLTGLAPLFLFYSAGGSSKKGKKDLAKLIPQATSLDLLSPTQHPDAMKKALAPLI
jgi:hypothetical protein